MDGNLEISIDKLPIKRVDLVEDTGAERFPPDVGHDESRLQLIRKIDFAWAVEREEEQSPENKKRKKDNAPAISSTSSQPWQWQSLVENLQLAQQELSIIVDAINTVQTNDSVTVSGMSRPKQLPDEHLSDLAVSTATKLKCFSQLGKYFKKSAKAMENQVARESTFYDALIRLQRNWKVKRHRMVPGNEGFYIDLYDSSLNDPTISIKPSSLSTICLEHDSAGLLAVNLPPNSRRSLVFKLLGDQSSATKLQTVINDGNEASNGDFVRKTNTLLRDVHRSIFHEQVFDLLSREAVKSSKSFYVNGIQENVLRLSIGKEASVSISLGLDDLESEDVVMESVEESQNAMKKSAISTQTSFAIYLQQLYHEHVLVKAKNRSSISSVLDHFSLSLAHRIFSGKVLTVLENLVCGIPYAHLMSRPTWHARTSSWTLLVKTLKSEFSTKVLVTDDCITMEGEGAPSVIGLFKGKSETCSPMNRYSCDLGELPMFLLQQIASQIVSWLYHEARSRGLKTSRDFLTLSFELEQGEILRVLPHLDPEDAQGCISWWLVMGEKKKLQMDVAETESTTRRFLGYMPLETLHSTLFDMVGLSKVVL